MYSEKYEFEEFGYKYTEHYYFNNWRILENNTNGRCIKFYCDRIYTDEEYKQPDTNASDIIGGRIAILMAQTLKRG